MFTNLTGFGGGGCPRTAHKGRFQGGETSKRRQTLAVEVPGVTASGDRVQPRRLDEMGCG